ncbi:MAG: tRNA dihydrouridine synthase [Spirochaetales bacterium]
MSGIWHTLPRPIHALAPMEDVTDTVFRRLVQRWGRPDIVFTEFIHAEIVLRDRKDRPGLTPRLQFTTSERPIIAQIWGNDPEEYSRAAVRLAELGFDGIDINMGCPVRKIRKRGACSALIEQPGLAAELIAAAKSGGLPVSVKTRIGFRRVQTEEWVGHLLEQEIDALTVHGRIATQESEGDSNWDEIARAALIARVGGYKTAVLGNGDVTTREQMDAYAERYKLDGVMVGRGIFYDPHLFRGSEGKRFADLDPAEKVTLLEEHLELYQAHWAMTRNYEILKKYYKIYLSGFPGCDELRDKLNQTHTYEEAREVLRAWRVSHRDEGAHDEVRFSAS